MQQNTSTISSGAITAESARQSSHITEATPATSEQPSTSAASSTSGSSKSGTGIKYDQDKPDFSLLSSVALTKVAEVMTHGKRKYSANNWRGGFTWSRPLAACLRHVFAYLGGQDRDPETGISHLAHAACCLMFVLEFEETHKELDDRWKPDSK